jgi:lipopolysaccharide export system protein LptA
MPAERRILAAVLWLALAGFPGPQVAAQGLGLGAANDGRPIEVTADSGIEWQQNAQIYVARGNAMAKRGNTEVHADTLTAHYRKAKGAEGGTEIYRLDADGHVRINNDKDTVVGDQAVYDVDQQIALITGKGLKLTTPTDVVTARDSLEWYDAKQVAVARGDAVAVRADRRIRADVLTAHMTKSKAPDAGKPAAAAPAAAKPPLSPAKPVAAVKSGAASDEAAKEDSRISRVDAQGNVVVSTSTDIGRGDYGVYDADTGIVTLVGNVVITRGQNALRGQYAVVDLNRNVSRMMTLAAKPGAPAPRVEGIFVRQQQPASGGAAAAAAKPSAPGEKKHE